MPAWRASMTALAATVPGYHLQVMSNSSATRLLEEGALMSPLDKPIATARTPSQAQPPLRPPPPPPTRRLPVDHGVQWMWNGATTPRPTTYPTPPLPRRCPVHHLPQSPRQRLLCQPGLDQSWVGLLGRWHLPPGGSTGDRGSAEHRSPRLREERHRHRRKRLEVPV